MKHTYTKKSWCNANSFLRILIIQLYLPSLYFLFRNMQSQLQLLRVLVEGEEKLLRETLGCYSLQLRQR